MSHVKLYSTAITLGIWAALWWIGLRGDRLVGVFLTMTAITAVISERERRRRRRQAGGCNGDS